MQLKRRFLAIAVVCSLPVIASAQQIDATLDGGFQVRHAVGLSATNDTVVNFTNTGASWGEVLTLNLNGAPNTPVVNSSGNICVNVYVFTPDEQLQECCSVLVTPNALWSASGFKQLTNSPVGTSPLGMSSVVIKMMATSTNSGVSPTCPTKAPFNQLPATGGPPFPGGATFGPYLPVPDQGIVSTGNPFLGLPFTATNNNFGSSFLVNGLAAWARNAQGKDTPFTNSSLSALEWFRNTELCNFIATNGSGPGICSFTLGGQ